MELRLAGAETFFFLFEDGRQLRANSRVGADCAFIEQGYVAFGQRADGKFTVPGVPDFADSDHAQGPAESLRHLGGHDYPAARQPQYQVGLNCLRLQQICQFEPCVFA